MDGYDRELGALTERVNGLGAALAEHRQEHHRTHLELKAMILHLGDSVTKRQDGHERRIGALERWRSYIAGGLAVLATVLTFGKWLVGLMWRGPGQ